MSTSSERQMSSKVNNKNGEVLDSSDLQNNYTIMVVTVPFQHKTYSEQNVWIMFILKTSGRPDRAWIYRSSCRANQFTTNMRLTKDCKHVIH